MFLGLDLGTSAVKALLMDANGNVVASRSSPLTVERPHQGWSEQDPESWWLATQKAVAELKQIDPSSLAAVRAIGLSGQMHGLTALDHAMKPLRAAILWNDARRAAGRTHGWHGSRIPQDRRQCRDAWFHRPEGGLDGRE